MSREVYLTTVEALAAIEELTEDDEHQIDLVIAPPEISVVSDEEGLDDNDLTENEMLLPDAAGLIEVHQTTGKKTGDSLQGSSQQAFRKSKFNGTRPKNAKSKNVERKWSDKLPAFTSAPVNKETKELERIEIELGWKVARRDF